MHGFGTKTLLPVALAEIPRKADLQLYEANQNLVMKIFHELHAEGHTIITVTHSPDVGNEAQRCIVLEHGRIKDNA